MQWALIPSSIGASATLIVLLWRIRDAIRARARIVVHSAEAGFSASNGTGCDGWHVAMHVENMSSAPDVLREVRVLIDGQAAPLVMQHASATNLPARLEPRMPTLVRGALTGGPVGAPGSTASGTIELEFSRAGLICLSFEASCRPQ